MSSFQWLKTVVEENNTRTGKYFDLFIQSLIIISLITFSTETIPDCFNSS